MKSSLLAKMLRAIRSKECSVLLLGALCTGMTIPIFAQEKPNKIQMRSVSYGVPSGYTQVGTTMLYYYQSSSSIDIQGCFNGMYYGSTFSNGGYRVAMQVNNGSSIEVDCLTGSTLSGVTFSASIEQQGELAKICYVLTNTNGEDAVVSLGVHADVMIGNNDRAPISRRIDTSGNTYGVTMKDGNGAQLCVLFGSGLAGVTSVNDYWFGYYGLNRDPYQMVGNYSSGSNYMQENGSYDSGMGWCWKNRTIPAGATVVFSYLIGVGEVNLEPNSSFEVTPDDPEGWNDLSRPHKLTLEGVYESPAGLDGMIEYAVEDDEDWIQLTDMIPSGSTFNNSLVAMFDATRENHVIRFRTRDNVGNTTLLPSIEYKDVSFHEYSGIVDKTYTGDALYQDVSCVDEEGLNITTGGYSNNVNAGTASFNIEGVFPYTIGRKPCTFQINPQPLSGSLDLTIENYVYDGQQHCPGWSFTNETYAQLEEERDYQVVYADNIKPGTATLTVYGMGNYTAALSKTFLIDKAQLIDELFSIELPDADISYDGQEHQATASVSDGVGEVYFTYTLHGETSSLAEAPKEEGSYDIYMEIADGELYYGRTAEYVGSFSIYKFDEAEWQSLAVLFAEIKQMGTVLPWNLAEGAAKVGSFKELTVRAGHVVGVSLANKGLAGLFPMTLTAFPYLEALDLSGNNLSGDLPMTIAALKTKEPLTFSRLKNLDISSNRYNGNVGLLCNSITGLTSLNASCNKFEDLYPLPPSSLVDLDITNQEMDRIVELNMSDLSFDALSTQLPTILLYNHEIHDYNHSINLLCTKADLHSFDKYTTEEWAIQFAISEAGIAIPYVSRQNAYDGESGDLLNVLNMTGIDSSDGSSFRIKFYFSQGDANFVNGVDVTDLQATILYAFGEYRMYPFNFTAANTFKDETINIQDVICTVNLLLAMNEEQLAVVGSKQMSGARAMAADDTDASIFLRDGQIILYSKIPVASLSIAAHGDVRWNLGAMGLQQSTSGGNVVAYSLDGVTIPCNEEVIIGEYTDISICSASLSDSNAQAITTGFDGTVSTSIREITDEGLNSSEIYGISGYRKYTLTEGVNIIRTNGKTRKIYKK